MSEVTRILKAIEGGDPAAASELLPLVYDELKRVAGQKMAQEAAGHTLQATALVHEAYVRLVDGDGESQWNSRGHFYCAAAEAMRRILIEHARGKARLKRGGDRERVELDFSLAGEERSVDEWLDLEDALQAFAKVHPEKAQLVELRAFTGLSLTEIAAILEISLATAERYWTFSRAWLFDAISQDRGNL